MQNILIQLDTDPHPSTFDRVVAVDAGVDHLFSYGGVTAADVESLVHGAMFTRGPKDLSNTAIFIGGSQVAAGEALLRQVQATFFGPLRVSVLMDSNGSNTTAAAAVLSALKHVDPQGARTTVLGATGPVGQRVAQLMARLGAHVRVVSRSTDRAADVCQAIVGESPDAVLEPLAARGPDEFAAVCQDARVVFAAGAAGVRFLDDDARQSLSADVLIDLNAVPPAGIAGIDVTARGVDLEGAAAWGAIGVGGTKMKIHKAAIRQLFTANDHVLDTQAVFELGRDLESG